MKVKFAFYERRCHDFSIKFIFYEKNHDVKKFNIWKQKSCAHFQSGHFDLS